MLTIENDFDIATGECPVEHNERARFWRRVIAGLISFWTAVAVLAALIPAVATILVWGFGLLFLGGCAASLAHLIGGRSKHPISDDARAAYYRAVAGDLN